MRYIKNEEGIIEDLINKKINCDEAVILLRNMLINNPENINAKFTLAKLLSRSINQKNEAKLLFDELHGVEGNNKNYKLERALLLESLRRFSESIQIYKELINKHQHSFIARLRLLSLYISICDYTNAYKIIQSTNCDTEQLKLTKFFLEYRLGIIKNVDYNSLENYTLRQLVKYKYSEVISHISKHQYEDKNKEMHSLLISGISIPDLYDDATIAIDKYTHVNKGITDFYNIDMKKTIGFVNGKPTPNLRVICIANTKDITTVYPMILNNIELDKTFFLTRKK